VYINARIQTSVVYLKCIEMFPTERKKREKDEREQLRVCATPLPKCFNLGNFINLS
jgi:hypothetical protein